MSADLTGQTHIVVGGAGYIGSHVCKMIAKHGGEPVTFDNFSSGHVHAVRWGPAIEVDVCKTGDLAGAFEQYSHASSVIHLASSIEVGLGEKDPAGFYKNNVLGAFNLLEAMRAFELKRLIFSSTCATYGETDKVPLTEDQNQNPFSVYGKTKLAIEHMIESYHKAYDLQYITLRYFNAAGADPDGDIGEEHDPETHLIPIALASAAGQRGKMKIFGTDYDTPDGTCIRDYIHVNDIARAHILGLEKFDQGLDALSVNIGTGAGYSNLEILKAIERVTGLELPYDPSPRRPGDVTRLFADASRARDALGFKPIDSDLDNIVATAWNFHKARFKEA